MEKVTAKEFLGEALGTFILVFFGLGSVAVEVATDITLGLPVIALIWGAAVALAIQICGPLSGAHINSAMTLAFATWTDFSWRKVPGYLSAQFLGAMLGALAVYALFSGAISDFEASNGIIRGKAGSEASAKIFGEFYQSPLLKAFIWEGSGTFFLAFGVFWLIGKTKQSRLKKWLPLMIGLWLAVLIWLVAPVTQAGFNPARDLGPRIITALLGWDTWSFEANGWGFLLVYVIAPCLGALLGGSIRFGALTTLIMFSTVWWATVRVTAEQRALDVRQVPPRTMPLMGETLRIGAFNIAHGRGSELGKSNWDGGTPEERLSLIHI